jgi:glycosyltransferase involved in cell wall biosynthesis
MSPNMVSLVLPCRNQEDHIEAVLSRYLRALEHLPLPFELVVVPNACSDRTEEVVRGLAARDLRVRVCALSEGGWGRAVQAGLATCRGELLAYTNTARTRPESLPAFVLRCLERGPCLVKASRQHRRAPLRTLGSFFYNLEARLLFGLRVRDVNGTPKVFHRDLYRRLRLTSLGDLLDLELLAQVSRNKTPVLELSVTGFQRHGGESSTTLASAFKMYAGAFRMWWASLGQLPALPKRASAA